MKITFVTVSVPAIRKLIGIEKEIRRQFPGILQLDLYYAIEMTETQIKRMEDSISHGDMVFVDLMGSPPGIVKAVHSSLERCRGNIIPYGNSAREYLRLGEFTHTSTKKPGKKMDMEAMKKMKSMADKMGDFMPRKMKDMANYGKIMRYFKSTHEYNVKNMLYLMLREYGGYKKIPKAGEPRDSQGVYLWDLSNMAFYDNYESFNSYVPFDKSLPTVALLFYGHTYPTDTWNCVREVKEALEKFANILPISLSGTFGEYGDNMRSFLVECPFKIDAVINFMSFRLGAGPMGGEAQAGIDLLQEVDAPYLHPFFMTRKTIKQWKESIQGCSPSEVLISVMLPELDGSIETYPIGAMGDVVYDEEFQVITQQLNIIPERLESMVNRVKKHINLRKKKNEHKRIAIICYNYPPGESNLFGGAFLDTFASVENILKNMKEQGYSVQSLSKEQLMNIFTAGKAVNSGKYDVDWDEMITYPIGKYTDCTRKDLMEEVKEVWGPPPGNIMSTRQDFLVPGTILDNVFIGLQPSRGIHEEPDKAYHDKTLPPHHQYMAFYQWIQKEFKADAIIHVGTHGTLEFLKGKEWGMSTDCYPDVLIGDIPHIYLYYCGNPSEATIAKRRSHANIVSYQPPVFVEGELNGEYSKLMTLVDNYHQSIAFSPGTSGEIMDEIIIKARELKLPEDLEEMEKELYRIKTSQIPKGLHTFGHGFDEDESKEYAQIIMKYSHGDIESLRSVLAKAKGMDFEKIYESNDYHTLSELDKEANRIFDNFIEDESTVKAENLNEIEDEAIKTLSYGKSIIEKAQINHEMKGLLKVLEGRYNPAKLAGDIFRYPDILPTGYNLFQFDPRLIPTNAAFIRGKKICDNTLKMYNEENKSYPTSTAVILWGLETSRTQGETFSQILAYLGVRISSKTGEWDIRYDIIPIKELGRPRIDVTINICGFFRDMFPNLIESLDDLFHELNSLEEGDDENYFKANTRNNYQMLIEKGYSTEEARELALSRIFGPGEGEYGTGISKLFETRNWEQEEQIGNVFLHNLQYVYNRNYHGKKVEDLYKENLKSVEVISQIRSSHEYQITDLDHYYEFFGGLSKSVEMVKGRKAHMYISDTTEEQIYSEGVDKSIARGVRTRVLNPKWIDGLLEHEYHGVQEIAKRVENILGLAATTGEVDQWIYEDMFKCYVEDDNLRKRLIENNPYAYMDILETMKEYNDRGYWSADNEQMDKIKEAYLQAEEDVEESM